MNRLSDERLRSIMKESPFSDRDYVDRAEDMRRMADELLRLRGAAREERAPGQALGSGDLTYEQLDGMELWDRDVMLNAQYRAAGSMLVRRAVAEIRRRRTHSGFTEEQAREVVREVVKAVFQAEGFDVLTNVDGWLRIVNVIASSAAERLASAPPWSGAVAFADVCAARDALQVAIAEIRIALGARRGETELAAAQRVAAERGAMLTAHEVRAVKMQSVVRKAFLDQFGSIDVLDVKSADNFADHVTRELGAAFSLVLSPEERGDLLRLRSHEETVRSAAGHLDLGVAVQCGRVIGLIDRLLAGSLSGHCPVDLNEAVAPASLAKEQAAEVLSCRQNPQEAGMIELDLLHKLRERLYGLEASARRARAEAEAELAATQGSLIERLLASPSPLLGCPVHLGAVHGGEAEELRNGIEALIAYGGAPIAELQKLLDRVEARDSLGHLERIDFAASIAHILGDESLTSGALRSRLRQLLDGEA